jgi:hypothetical protein
MVTLFRNISFFIFPSLQFSGLNYIINQLIRQPTNWLHGRTLPARESLQAVQAIIEIQMHVVTIIITR